MKEMQAFVEELERKTTVKVKRKRAPKKEEDT